MDKITFGELKAYAILKKEHSMTTDIKPQDYHNAANEIILLAKSIESERAVVAMISDEN